MQPRKKRNSSKVNLFISLVFHSLLILAIFFLAAREGMLGKKLKQLTVTMVPKEKKPEPPKEKPPEQKVEPPKTESAPKLAATAPPKVQAEAPPPPVADTPAVAAPPPASIPAFEFNDGAKQVETLSDANSLYKALMEHSLLARWNRPENIADDNFIAEAELTMDDSGRIEGYKWLSGSGNARWDDSVKTTLGAVKGISRRPPKGFPHTFVVRFDVESLKTEAVLQASNLR